MYTKTMETIPILGTNERIVELRIGLDGGHFLHHNSGHIEKGKTYGIGFSIGYGLWINSDPPGYSRDENKGYIVLERWAWYRNHVGNSYNRIETSPDLPKLVPVETLLSIYEYFNSFDTLTIPEFTSPIEESFWYEWHQHGADAFFPLTCQYEVPGTRYRLDFAAVDNKFAIELDGYEWHSSKEQFTNDRRRQRELEALGWRFVRFSGSEVYKNAGDCALQAAVSFCDFLMSSDRN